MKTPDLKPCPFCGGEAFAYEVKPHKHFLCGLAEYDGGGFVECTGCSCGVSGKTKEEAVEVWNRRESDGESVFHSQKE